MVEASIPRQGRRERRSVAASRASRLRADHEQRRRARPPRLDGAEQRDRHALTAKAEREAFDEAMMDAENFDAAGETAERARQEHGGPT